MNSTKGENIMETKVNTYRTTSKMKAIVNTQYGSPDVLQLKEIERPTPKDDEVLVKVYAVSVNAADLHLLRADPFLIRLSSGLLKPKNKIFVQTP